MKQRGAQSPLQSLALPAQLPRLSLREGTSRPSPSSSAHCIGSSHCCQCRVGPNPKDLSP